MAKANVVPMVAGVLLVSALAWFVLQAIPQRQIDRSGPLASRDTIFIAQESAAVKSLDGQQSAAKDDNKEDLFGEQRQEMVSRQLESRDITDKRVLEVMGRIPRHRFVPSDLQDDAYRDSPLPIGHDQTISQPYIVALMTQCAEPKPKSRALDIGTGSGYQAAVLAELVEQVYSIEIVEPLADDAHRRLKELGYKNIEVRSGDGYRGWPEHAPFDLIIVAAAPDHVPQPLVDQLAAGGKLVIPVGDSYQDLLVIEKQADGTVQQRNVAPVRFVPMTGEAERRK